MKVYTGSPNSQLTVEDQKEIFQIRSITNSLPSNRGIQNSEVLDVDL